MIDTLFMTPSDAAQEIARLAKIQRLSLNMSQRSLSEKSGVSLAVIKKFEQSGKIALVSLLKLALVLESLDDFTKLFMPAKEESFSTLDTLLKQKSRQRGRK